MIDDTPSPRWEIIPQLGRAQLYAFQGTGRHTSHSGIRIEFPDIDYTSGGGFDNIVRAELIHTQRPLPDTNLHFWFDDEDAFYSTFPQLIALALELTRACRRAVATWPVEQTLAYRAQGLAADAAEAARFS